MKRFLQFVAVVVSCLVAAQPALAVSASCMPATHAACAPNCPMAMSSAMGPDCPMANQAAASECAPDCCTATQLQAAAVPATAEKPQLSGPSTAAVPVKAATGTGPAQTLQAQQTTPAASPPLYLLHRVFRI